MTRRRITLGIVAALALLAVQQHPTASLRIETHDAADLTPRRVQAAIDVGLVAVNVLVTWSERIAR
jgi:hypothetical protein